MNDSALKGTADEKKGGVSPPLGPHYLDYAPASRSRDRRLILMLLLMGLLAAFAFYRMTMKSAPFGLRHTLSQARVELPALETALDAFRIDTGVYPTAGQGLDALVVVPANVENWHGPYISKPSPVRDPWGTPYIYVFPGIRNKNGFDLSSAGPDMTAGTKDDIQN